MTVSSLRTRGASDGWIAPEIFAELTDLRVDEVRRGVADGTVVSTALDHTQRTCCRASEMIRALVLVP